MNPLENIRLATKAITSNFLRSLLTISIIATGILALVGILTALDVLLYSLSDNLSDFGANTFSIEQKNESIKGRRRGRKMTVSEPVSFEQATKFKERYDYPALVSIAFTPTASSTIKYQDKKSNPNVAITGCDINYFKARGLELQNGRLFNETEIENANQKAVIGSDICKLLFDGKAEKALGKTIQSNKAKYNVIGVMKSKGSSMTSSTDRSIFIPITNAHRYYNTVSTHYDLSVLVENSTDMEGAESEAIGTLRNIRQLKAGEENDFEIIKSSGMMEMLKENTLTIRLATIAIGIITLLAAAIGLMNIMLVSVTERTREIGVCKALGASKRNIRLQFLTEAVVISLIGGLVGVLLGLLVGLVVAQLMNGVFVMPWNWISLGLFMCFLVGVVSGLYPAIRASNLDPIEALRHD